MYIIFAFAGTFVGAKIPVQGRLILFLRRYHFITIPHETAFLFRINSCHRHFMD